MKFRTAGPTGYQLAVWYALLLVPTLALKVLYVSTVSEGNPLGLDPAFASSRLATLRLYSTEFLPIELLEGALIVAVLFLLGHVLLRVRIERLVFTSVLAVCIVGWLNAVSLEQIGALLTPETIGIAWNWGRQHPGVGLQLISMQSMAVTGGLTAWVMLTGLITRRVTSREDTVYTAREGSAYFTFTTGALAIFITCGAFEATAIARSTGLSLNLGWWTNVALSMLRAEDTNPLHEPIPAVADLSASYSRLAFPDGAQDRGLLVNLPAERRVPRHIVFIALETAPLKYYPIPDSADFPVFHGLRQHAIVSDTHYTSAPSTELAIYSIMTGTYPRPGSPIGSFGEFRADSLPIVLNAHGYESTFIDSYDLDWNGDDAERMIRQLGFSNVLDSRQLTMPHSPDRYAQRVAQERRSFDEVATRIEQASRDGRKAFVYLSTNLGHFEWASRPDRPGASSAEKLADTVHLLDRLVGDLIDRLNAARLGDDVILAVVGDHGLRWKPEFDSLHEQPTYGDVTFNVPLIVYAPGLFASEIRLPYPTSHVDLAPTMLDLIGVERRDRLYHGDNLLANRLQERLTFMPSGSYHGMHPADSFRWRGTIYTVYDTTNRVAVRTVEREPGRVGEDNTFLTFTDRQAMQVIRDSRLLFNATAGEFLRRRQAAGLEGGRARK